MNYIKSKCISVFSKSMEVSPDVINDDTSPETLMEWDSLSHVLLISELEKEFSIEISPEEGIELESFTSVCEFIKEKISK